MVGIGEVFLHGRFGYAVGNDGPVGQGQGLKKLAHGKVSFEYDGMWRFEPSACLASQGRHASTQLNKYVQFRSTIAAYRQIKNSVDQN
ncbi:hypothetical protein I1957_19430 [Pseudomonas aeruginosa]|jgi:hypothetical protein|nr:hypothetical protein [Pseudomonas aeruginosa]HEH6424226.1 hypothetical protein [Pseudomonas aeruginosa]